MNETCFLVQFSELPCSGQLRRCHLIDAQLLRRRCLDVWDERVWVPGCGGIVGLSAHHGQLDSYNLTIPRHMLPAGVEEFAAEHGLEYWLDRRYGPSICRECGTALPEWGDYCRQCLSDVGAAA